MSISTTLQTTMTNLRASITGTTATSVSLTSQPLNGAATLTTASDPGDTYSSSGLVVDPVGFASAAYATRETVGAVSAALGESAASTASVTGQVRGFSKGFSAVRQGLASNVGIGTAIGAGLSFVGNAFGLVTGRLSPGQAAGRFVTDTVGAGLSATGAALIGGAATAALGAVGIAGLPLTLCGIGASMLAGWAVDAAYRRSHAASAIYGTVSGALGG